jgi:hypothetical protein
MSLVVEGGTEALARVGFIFPNIKWLYGSWISFILAGISVLISRKLYAYYIASAGMKLYKKLTKTV